MFWWKNRRVNSWKNPIENILRTLSPAQAVVFGFLFLIAVGTTLLMLPAASQPGKTISLIDAVFTATSASCITGLVVVDTHDHWSLFGQIVILTLVQIGGLGILTMATLISVIIGRRVTYKERLIVKESLNQSEVEGIVKLTKRIIYITLIIEAIGATLLFIRFIPEFGIARGLYMGVFHSISGFCNSGFSLMGDYRSLTAYYHDGLTVLTIAGLVIIGGLGFAVWNDIIRTRKISKLMLHSKIVLSVTTILFILGTLLFFALESVNSQTLGGMSIGDKIMNSFFQSAACMSSGFNTIPINQLTEESKLVSMILMFIGASPGSTGGGIKTVTFGVMILTVVSILEGKEHTEMFRRTIPQRIIKKSLAIVFFALSLVLFMILLLSVCEDIPLLDISFEVVSAFGTVGLSTGITPSLSEFSKLMISMAMFLGRVGPLTLTFALARRLNRRKQNYSYPEGRIMVG